MSKNIYIFKVVSVQEMQWQPPVSLHSFEEELSIATQSQHLSHDWPDHVPEGFDEKLSMDVPLQQDLLPTFPKSSGKADKAVLDEIIHWMLADSSAAPPVCFFLLFLFVLTRLPLSPFPEYVLSPAWFEAISHQLQVNW